MAQEKKNKMLLLFCDGTSQDGTLASNNGTGVNTGTQEATNVVRLSRAVKLWTADGRRQIVLYVSGVGSDADFNGQAAPGSLLLLALGTAVASKIRDAYAYLAQNYEDGDEICIFGFSRGAYISRKLAALIDKVGLLETKSLGHFFDIWKALVDGKQPVIPPGTRHPRIRCVGVWDTVDGVFGTINSLSMDDATLPATIDCALHAVSFHENREWFIPTLWAAPVHGMARLPSGGHQIHKEIWFPGDHFNVGGGHERHDLADLALFWMAGEIKSFINLDLEFLREFGQRNPEPWGKTQPNNAFQTGKPVEKAIYGHKTRLESAQLGPLRVFHPSLEVSPVLLSDKTFMITLPDLRKAFGVAWKPNYCELNEFEKHCKDNWGKYAPSEELPKVESPGDLFGGQA